MPLANKGEASASRLSIFANNGDASASRLSTLANRGLATASPMKEARAMVENFIMKSDDYFGMMSGGQIEGFKRLNGRSCSLSYVRSLCVKQPPDGVNLMALRNSPQVASHAAVAIPQ